MNEILGLRKRPVLFSFSEATTRTLLPVMSCQSAVVVVSSWCVCEVGKGNGEQVEECGWNGEDSRNLFADYNGRTKMPGCGVGRAWDPWTKTVSVLMRSTAALPNPAQ